VKGLWLRDLQEALYFLLGKVLSHNAVNRVTLRVQAHMERQRQAAIEHTPAILIVDGVWVEIQYPTGLFKQDRAGHMRQSREAEERVILSVMAVWPDGSYELLHYQIAAGEDETAWLALFDAMIGRGLDPQAVQLVVSDGAKGLLAAMAQRLPQARQQRCIAHKVRGMEPYLSYQQLPEQTDDGQPLTQQAAKEQRRFLVKRDAYDRRKSRRDDIYNAPSYEEAQGRLEAFVAKWQALEPKAVHAFTWGIKRTFTFYDFDAALYPHIRTTNHLERFFREFRAKADEIGAFPNELSCLTLFFVVMQREHAKHDRIAVAKTS
jgi:putative transposase